ncbi:hypothetical protein [Falsiphaeobacter marinintestinus]|uniref:hypothetical protein n=1 Tax=Falsiphaeobacter marinintestinus TaxID=1492905 RepID=UPI0011B63626|nr:hypothetical protein [Phaeobacter marinintestinus]
MFGVVLWSDPQEQKAVIWCEDHGDLAFYRQPDDGEQVTLDAGDWVQFEMTMDRQMRHVHNPRLVAEGLFPEIANALPQSGHGQNLPDAIRPQTRQSAEIVPFRRPGQASHHITNGATAHQA